MAAANFIKGGTNRVILCTDGDWNVGTTGTPELVKMIEEKRGTGVFLSVFGFGMGNLRDEMMVQLAGKGNGNYGYIDSLKEANKALVEQLGGTLVTVAKDVKIQVEFNPAAVKSYRLLGYEKRALAAKDFHDDKKDAGEMGAGHVVTALYELVPAGVAAPAEAKADGLRYQPNPEPKPAAKGEQAKESFVVKMRHKKPDSDTSTLPRDAGDGPGPRVRGGVGGLPVRGGGGVVRDAAAGVAAQGGRDVRAGAGAGRGREEARPGRVPGGVRRSGPQGEGDLRAAVRIHPGPIRPRTAGGSAHQSIAGGKNSAIRSW